MSASPKFQGAAGSANDKINYPSLGSLQHNILGYSRGSVYGDVMQFDYQSQTSCLDPTLFPVSSRDHTRVYGTILGLERCDVVVRTTDFRWREAGFEPVVTVSYTRQVRSFYIAPVHSDVRTRAGHVYMCVSCITCIVT